MNLFKYDCGCIGFEDARTIIRACDTSCCDSEREYGIATHREMNRPETREALTAEETSKIIEDLRALIIDGYRYREIKKLLS